MVAGATIMLDVKACGPEWKASFSMTATIRKAWPRMSWEFLFGDISSVTGTTGGSALPTVGFLLWLSVRDTTNLWAWLHRKWYLWDKCVNQYWQYHKPKLTSGFCAKKYSAIRWLYHKSKGKNGKVITKVESRVQNLKVAFKMWNSFTKRESRMTIELKRLNFLNCKFIYRY